MANNLSAGRQECYHPHQGMGLCDRCVEQRKGVATLMKQYISLGGSMERNGPELDDVLDLYSLMSDECGKDMLPDICKMFPQFEVELKTFAKYREMIK